MNITFVEKKLQVSEDIKNYARKKVSKLDRYFRKDCDATIKFGALRGFQTVEITVIHDSIVFRSNVSTNDMYASIDSAIDNIIRQIHKNKTRLEKRLRQGAFDWKAPSASESAAETMPPEVEEDVIDIVRTKRFSLKPMTAEEAVMQMNLLGHEFFAFTNSTDGSFAVVYKRKNGGYGLIEAD